LLTRLGSLFLWSVGLIKIEMYSPLNTILFIAKHPLASRRMLASLYRYGWWQVASRLQDTVEYQWVGGSTLLVKNGMTGATGNIYCGLHEFGDMAFLLHFLRPGDLFVDVGANVGSYTTLASVVCGAHTIAVEPDPDTMRSLQANVKVNHAGDRVELVEAALGACGGSVRFTVGRDTVNHVTTNADPKARDVVVRRLDDVLAGRKPRLIKMDVEGYEAQVLAGAVDVLADPVLLAVITETSDAGVQAPLETHGFRRYAYEPFTRRLEPAIVPDIQTRNALFVRSVDAVRQLLSAAPRRRVAGVEL
jgi:FkbM family methyltransferase